MSNTEFRAFKAKPIRARLLFALFPDPNGLVIQFREAAASLGIPVDYGRMGFDRVYALDVIERVHARADNNLRLITMRLAQRYLTM